MEVNVAEQFGPICITPDAGAGLCAIASTAIREGERVHIDFSGVTTLATLFLNRSIGWLYGMFPAEKIDALLTLGGLEGPDVDLLGEVRINAKSFYAATPQQQDRIVMATDQLAGHCG
jgi:hypothetical protein